VLFSAPIQVPTAGSVVAIPGAAREASHSSAEDYVAEGEEQQTYVMLDRNAVIAAAIRAAGPVPRDSHSAARLIAARCTRPDYRGGFEGSWTSVAVGAFNSARCLADMEIKNVRWMSAIFLSAAVLAVAVSSAQESGSRAAAMLPQCTAWLRINSGGADAIMDEVRSAGTPAVALSQFEKAGFCAGFVLGLSEMLTAPFACMPNPVPTEQLVQAVVDFANRQPETMKDDFGLLVGAALSVAWPCPKDK
jgi:hypothetical protein